MELTQKTFSDRLELLRHLATEKPEDLEARKASLHEKGVECAVIVPLLEVILDFDALSDVTYEQSSVSHHGQRFDFLIDGKLLVEAKDLGANLDEHFKQVTTYIQKNTDINYGILTNGIEFQIWVERSFIEAVGNTQLPHTAKVAKVFELSLQNDSVQFILDVFSLLAKGIYEQTFGTVANVAAYYASGSRGRPPVLHNDKTIDEELRNRIRDAVVIQKGVFYEDVISGKLSPGDLLQYKNAAVEIRVEVTSTGTVILRQDGANVVDMRGAMRDGWANTIPLIADKWSKADTEFQDPLEIIRLALNKQKLHKKEQYTFEPVKSFSK